MSDNNPVAHIDDPNVVLDYYKAIDQEVAAYEIHVKKLKALRTHAEERMATLALTAPGQQKAVFHDGSTVEIKTTIQYNATDWDLFYQWILQDPLNRLSGFLNKRLGSQALAKMQKEQGVLPPGVAESPVSKTVVKATKG